MSPFLVIFLLVGGPLVAVAIHDLVRRPTFRRLAVRNISRRRSEAALIVLGSMLGTAIITSSFIVGDSIDASIRDIARTDLGPIDETVEIRPDGEVGSEVAELRAAVDAAAIDRVDGVLSAVTSSGALAAGAGEGRLGEPLVGVVEVDFDDARAFGGDPAATGMVDAGATPKGEDVVLNRDLATRLGLEAGDSVSLYLYGAEHSLVVRDVVPGIGLAGGDVAFIEPGTIEASHRSAVGLVAPPAGMVFVSNDGGIFAGADDTPEVMAGLDAAVARLGVDAELTPVKSDLLEEAAEDGSSIGSLFTFIGSFSVVAGVLLVVNLFIMLSEERKNELGMMRAVGMKRNHLLRAFGLEGALYSVLSGLVGAAVGIGVAWVLIQATTVIFTGDEFAFSLAVEPTALLGGAVYGALIGIVTVWATSARISRLNIISAIRDLPDPRRVGRRLGRLALGVVGVAVGGALTALGIGSDSAPLVVLGPGLALFSSLALTLRMLPVRPTIVATGVAVITWSVGVFTVLPEATRDATEYTFLVQGVMMVAAAVMLLVQFDGLWSRLAVRRGASGKGLAARLGLAYPLARRVRTGLLLGMYAMVVFVMMFLSVMDGILRSQADDFADQQRAGFDIFIDSNPSNPLTVDRLGRQPEVAAAAGLVHGFTEMAAPWEDSPGPWAITGYDESLLAFGGPELADRTADYATDRAALDAVLGDPSLVIVNDYFRTGDGGPPGDRVDPGDTITVVSPTGDEVSLQVVGVMAQDWIENGTLMSRDFVTELMGPTAVENRHYVKLAADVDADAEVAATGFDGRLLEFGADAASFTAVIDQELAENTGFFNLMRGYLAIGLLIGIAGLGVVMIRAVRERRREIGMLRAVGLSSRLVRRSFLVEATFLALQGIVLGILLGGLAAYQVLVNSDTFGPQQLSFEVPWLAVVLLCVVPLIASLLAVARPAARAAQIMPAAALRIAD